MQRICPNGHSYDSNLDSCPYCVQNGELEYESSEVSGESSSNEYIRSSKVALRLNGKSKGEIFIPQSYSQENNTECNTDCSIDTSHRETTFIGTVQETRIPPVVGWLVCSDGEDKGMDFRLHADYNYVGRAEGQVICLTDSTVSREHFSVAYDRLNNRYFVSMGRGKAIVYVNGNPLGKSMTVLRKGDRISVGHTTLVFIPLEQQDLKWEWQ